MKCIENKTHTPDMIPVYSVSQLEFSGSSSTDIFLCESYDDFCLKILARKSLLEKIINSLTSTYDYIAELHNSLIIWSKIWHCTISGNLSSDKINVLNFALHFEFLLKMDSKKKSSLTTSTVASTLKSPKETKENIKPNMRRLLYAKTKRDFFIALGAALTVSISYYYFVKVQRRRLFAELHRTYDADAAYERMKNDKETGLI
ncbi:hypothetical protein Btru_044425 [Bulinus truncatus]|nr:hypothetical protein Btru_044425 [Bulinus truncatus]